MSISNSSKPDLVQVQVIVNITFDANGEDHEWLRANAHRAIDNQFGSGGITAQSDAVVDSYDIKTALLTPQAMALDEESSKAGLPVRSKTGTWIWGVYLY